jgi:hypothetical protein
MSQLRTSIALARFDTGAAVEAGRLAEAWAVRTLWLGGSAVDPTYAAAAAGAVAATTGALRLGLFLDLDRSASPLRIAEDVAVLDNLSGGRVELALIASPGEAWRTKVEALLDAWEQGWPVPDGNPLAILPQPIQPLIPRLIAGDPGDADFVRRSAAGRLWREGEAPPPARRGIERRVLLIEPPFASLSEVPSEEEAVKRLTVLRTSAAAAGVTEIMFGAEPERFEATARLIGTLLDPAMRATLDDIAAIVGEAWQRRG